MGINKQLSDDLQTNDKEELSHFRLPFKKGRHNVCSLSFSSNPGRVEFYVENFFMGILKK